MSPVIRSNVKLYNEIGKMPHRFLLLEVSVSVGGQHASLVSA
eukprot:COSAG01_NODE_60975_length_291_cov_11.031250_1_plen_41_part_10